LANDFHSGTRKVGGVARRARRATKAGTYVNLIKASPINSLATSMTSPSSESGVDGSLPAWSTLMDDIFGVGIQIPDLLEEDLEAAGAETSPKFGDARLDGAQRPYQDLEVAIGVIYLDRFDMRFAGMAEVWEWRFRPELRRSSIHPTTQIDTSVGHPTPLRWNDGMSSCLRH
jgi:hypothetical protein